MGWTLLEVQVKRKGIRSLKMLSAAGARRLIDERAAPGAEVAA